MLFVKILESQQNWFFCLSIKLTGVSHVSPDVGEFDRLLFPVRSWKEEKISNDLVVIAAAVTDFNDQTSVSYFSCFFCFVLKSERNMRKR